MNFMGTLLVIVLTCWLATVSFAVDHTRSVGEPYELAGKRMVFTNWLYIRPGQIDWLNDKGESVYSSGDIEAGPTEAHFDTVRTTCGIFRKWEHRVDGRRAAVRHRDPVLR